MPPELKILLPPSEGKSPGGGGRLRTGAGSFGPALRLARNEVIAALAAADGGSQALLGVSGRHLDQSLAANRLVIAGRAPTLPAVQRYTGVVHGHAGLRDVPGAADGVIVLSALMGLVALDDPVPDYRLKMGASLPPLGRLSAWWRPRLSPVLNRRLRGADVVDLLPQEHAAAWAPAPRRYASLHRVRFRGADGAAGGHDAKAAKGLLARHLLTSGEPVAVALASFHHPRFTLELDGS
ncbi:MAG: uncharacterized protein QOJ57_2792 [Thermoleophilaceae bacterium]|nr:uncharacterized protein [Thermoleophilaceae bacterium]